MRVRILTLALLAAGSLLVAGCEDDDGGDTSTAPTTATAPTSPTSTAADDGSSSGDEADQGGGGGDSTGGSGSDEGSGGSGGSGGGSTGSGAAETDAGDEFAAELRSIVAEAFGGLQPLANPANAIGNPEAYAELLDAGSGEIDETVDRLEGLNPPADAKRGVGLIIDAFDGLGDAVDAAAEGFGSGDPGQITAARLALREATARFGAQLQRGAKSLRDAGYGVPGA